MVFAAEAAKTGSIGSLDGELCLGSEPVIFGSSSGSRAQLLRCFAGGIRLEGVVGRSSSLNHGTVDAGDTWLQARIAGDLSGDVEEEVFGEVVVVSQKEPADGAVIWPNTAADVDAAEVTASEKLQLPKGSASREQAVDDKADVDAGMSGRPAGVGGGTESREVERANDLLDGERGEDADGLEIREEGEVAEEDLLLLGVTV